MERSVQRFLTDYLGTCRKIEKLRSRVKSLTERFGGKVTV